MYWDIIFFTLSTCIDVLLVKSEQKVYEKPSMVQTEELI